MNWKLIILSSCMLAYSASVKAQYVSIGPTVAFGHSSVTQDEYAALAPEKQKFNPSFNAGLSLIYSRHEHWGFGFDLVYSKEGYRKNVQYNIVSGDTKINFDEANSVSYVRLPLRVYYFFGKYRNTVRPKIFLGPTIGIKVGEKFDREANNTATAELFRIASFPANPDYNAVDIGLQAGAGVNISLSRSAWLNLDLNYYQGLMDVLKDNTSSYNTGTNLNRNMRFSIGVLFALVNNKRS